jgi:sigma-E factor negative regulatory protein RseC
MISEQGVIEKIDDQMATVRVRKSSACAHCSSKGSCSISNRDMLVEVQNILNAGEGDTVEISVPEGTFLKLSFLVYLIPIFALMLGAFIGIFLSTMLNIDQSLSAIITGAVFFGISFLGLKVFERLKSSDRNYFPQMSRILKNGASPKPCDNI